MYSWEVSTKEEVRELIAWLWELDTFPTQIYLNGKTYALKNDTWRTLFTLGLEQGVELGGFPF
jgi:hypothetical protein